jgi:hypothetical protein
MVVWANALIRTAILALTGQSCLRRFFCKYLTHKIKPRFGIQDTDSY